MKKITILGLLLATIPISLGGCFWGYPDHDRDRGYHRGEDRDRDRDGGYRRDHDENR